MNRNWQNPIEIARPSVASMVPALFEEAGWDILLALHSDRSGTLGVDKLAAIASVPRAIAEHWLDRLADRHMVVAATQPLTGAPRPVLTSTARALLNTYLAAMTDLHSGAH